MNLPDLNAQIPSVPEGIDTPMFRPFRSMARWPEGTLKHQTVQITCDQHDTELSALHVCDALRRRRYGGEGRIFPLETWVEKNGQLSSPAPAAAPSPVGSHPAPADAALGRAEDHSPLPWGVCCEDKGGCTCGVIWSIPQDFPVATAERTMQDSPEMVYAEISEEQRRVNARFIVQALNNHASLTAELRYAKDDLAQSEKERLYYREELATAKEENARLREAITTATEAAWPSKSEHPAMWAAWQNLNKALGGPAKV